MQQHEALQRQQQLACLPRRDKALAADPRHQAQQARLAIRGMAGGSDDETDAEEQRALALQFEQPAKKGAGRVWALVLPVLVLNLCVLRNALEGEGGDADM